MAETPFPDADAVSRGCVALATVCADLRAGESALIVTDPSTSRLGDALSLVIEGLAGKVTHISIDPFSMHGQEPPASVAEEMRVHEVVFGLTSMSMAHTNARWEASKAGCRYLSLPDYSYDVITGTALQADFRGLTSLSTRLAAVLTEGSELRVCNRAGTDIRSSIEGRAGNAAPGWCDGKGSLASPPDSETNVALIEGSSQGRLVVDGSIPCTEIGLVESPVEVTVRGGSVVDVKGTCARVLQDLYDRVGDERTKVVGEMGIGLNPLAQLRGSMLEDEGSLGTIHFGIGANTVLGGINSVPFHLDHVLRSATLWVDGVEVMTEGSIRKEFLV